MADVPDDRPGDDLGAISASVPGWEGRARVVGELEGGITNRNLLVAVGAERFVVRRCGRDTHLLEIDRDREVEASSRAASLGIGPEVVDWLPESEALITRFVEGEPATAADIARPEVLAVVVARLRRFHDSGPLSGDFDAFRIPGRHEAVARERGVVTPEAYRRAAGFAAEIADAFSVRPDPRVPCHNDLLSTNIILTADGVRILDWEYAGNNNCYFDLANLAVNNGFGPDLEERLIRAYFGAVDRHRLARLRLMRIISDFREATWALVQQAVSTIAFDYAAYAEEHFDRLIGAATTEGYRRALVDAVQEG